MIKYTIRKAKKEDSKDLIGLVIALADFEHLDPPDIAAQKRLVKDIFEKKRLYCFLAFVDGESAGYALYFYTYSSFLARPTLYLEDIFVLEQYRRNKIGLSLFLRCVEEARKNDCGRMEWTVLTWNSKAIQFYEETIGARRMKEWWVYRLDRAGLERQPKPSLS